jgi:preprotein translocase subunit SecG
MMTFLFWLSIVLFIFVCVVLILLILIQKGRGGGLASAFSGGGGNTAFGSKTGDVLTWATSIVFGVFLLLGVVLNLIANYQQDRLTGGGTVVTQTTPSTPTPFPEPSTPVPGQ